ncbi:unnamed protein product, partial [Didymodactylos carnosus]
CLLVAGNEFEIYLKQCFPNLTTSQLTRRQWNIIRRILGKPRRLSNAFLQGEIDSLHSQRQLIRLLQYQDCLDKIEHDFRDLPKYIAQPLTVGTKVIARLRQPLNGLYSGQIAEINGDSIYRILFDDPEIGFQSVVDFEVSSQKPLQTILLSDKLKNTKFEIDLHHSNDENISGSSTEEQSDSDECTDNEGSDGENIQFPSHLLYRIVRVSCLLCAKRDLIVRLRNMHDRAEYEKSKCIKSGIVFCEEYAQLIQTLAVINERLGIFIEDINIICRTIVSEDQMPVFNDARAICERSEQQAKELIQKTNVNIC